MCYRLPELLAVSEKGPQTAHCVRVHLLHGCDFGCESEMGQSYCFYLCVLGSLRQAG